MQNAKGVKRTVDISFIEQDNYYWDEPRKTAIILVNETQKKFCFVPNDPAFWISPKEQETP